MGCAAPATTVPLVKQDPTVDEEDTLARALVTTHRAFTIARTARKTLKLFIPSINEPSAH